MNNNFIINEDEFKDVVINISNEITNIEPLLPKNILEDVVYVEPQNLPVPAGMCTTCYNPFGLK